MISTSSPDEQRKRLRSSAWRPGARSPPDSRASDRSRRIQLGAEVLVVADRRLCAERRFTRPRAGKEALPAAPNARALGKGDHLEAEGDGRAREGSIVEREDIEIEPQLAVSGARGIAGRAPCAIGETCDRSPPITRGRAALDRAPAVSSARSGGSETIAGRDEAEPRFQP